MAVVLQKFHFPTPHRPGSRKHHSTGAYDSVGPMADSAAGTPTFVNCATGPETVQNLYQNVENFKAHYLKPTGVTETSLFASRPVEASQPHVNTHVHEDRVLYYHADRHSL